MESGRHSGKAVVSFPMGVAGSIAEAVELGIGGDGDDDPGVVALAPVDVMGSHGRVSVADAGRRPACQLIFEEILADHGHGHIPQDDLNLLALSRAASLPNCSHDGCGDVECGRLVAVEITGLAGRAVLVAGDVAHAAQPLCTGAKGYVIAPRAGPPEGRHGDHDEVGAEGAEVAVGKAEVGHDAGAVVLDDDVAYGNKLLEQGLAAGVGEVQGDAALGAVDLVETGVLVIGALLRLVGGEDGHVADAAAPREAQS